MLRFVCCSTLYVFVSSWSHVSGRIDAPPQQPSRFHLCNDMFCTPTPVRKTDTMQLRYMGATIDSTWFVHLSYVEHVAVCPWIYLCVWVYTAPIAMSDLKWTSTACELHAVMLSLPSAAASGDAKHVWRAKRRSQPLSRPALSSEIKVKSARTLRPPPFRMRQWTCVYTTRTGPKASEGAQRHQDSAMSTTTSHQLDPSALVYHGSGNATSGWANSQHQEWQLNPPSDKSTFGQKTESQTTQETTAAWREDSGWGWCKVLCCSTGCIHTLNWYHDVLNQSACEFLCAAARRNFTSSSTLCQLHSNLMNTNHVLPVQQHMGANAMTTTMLSTFESKIIYHCHHKPCRQSKHNMQCSAAALQFHHVFVQHNILS